jgi:voltage-gated potassium channel
LPQIICRHETVKMNGHDSNQHEEIGVFQIVVLILSIVVLGALFIDTAFKLPEEISKVLEWTDTGVCFLLIADFGIRFHRAKSKLQFLKWGWIDLLASIPNLPILRVGRLIRILRIIRLLRAIRATQRVSHILLRNKFHGGLASVFLTFLLLIMFSSVGILVCEQPDPSAKIKTAEDSIWWSVATITTVGYGEQKEALSKYSLAAVILTETVLNAIRHELKQISPDVRIDTEQIRSVLEREVLKEDVVKEEKMDDARKLVAKAANKERKNKADKFINSFVAK